MFLKLKTFWKMFLKFAERMPGSQRDRESTRSGSRKNHNRSGGSGRGGKKKCRKQKYRDYFIEEHGCRSKKAYKMARCLGPEGNEDSVVCVPTKIKTRKVKFVCPDGSTPRKEVEIIRRCGRKKKSNTWKK
jgi:hypothetical protein